METDLAAERRRFNRGVLFGCVFFPRNKACLKISCEILLIKPEMSRLRCYISLYEIDARP